MPYRKKHKYFDIIYYVVLYLILCYFFKEDVQSITNTEKLMIGSNVYFSELQRLLSLIGESACSFDLLLWSLTF